MADAAPPAPIAMDPEARARRLYNNPALYPEPAGQPAPAASPSPSSPSAPAAAEEKHAQPETEKPSRDPDEVAGRIFDKSAPTRGMVEWDEPAAMAADYKLTTDAQDVLDTSPEGVAAMDRLRAGFEAAGAGPTLAKELFNDAVMAHQGGFARQGLEAAERELRQHFGGRYDAAIARAQGLIHRAAEKSPELIPFLERTGLGNNVAFIKKVAAAATRRGRR